MQLARGLRWEIHAIKVWKEEGRRYKALAGGMERELGVGRREARGVEKKQMLQKEKKYKKDLQREGWGGKTQERELREHLPSQAEMWQCSSRTEEDIKSQWAAGESRSASSFTSHPVVSLLFSFSGAVMLEQKRRPEQRVHSN